MSNTGYKSTGELSTGNWSTGDWSTGNLSTGDRSTGNKSTGYRSTGDWSTGYKSTGYWSTGDWSTGNRSTGDWSTGNWSTGDRSTGNWSISDYSTGHFSTRDYAGFDVFNKPCTVKEWNNANKPHFIFFDLTEWVKLCDMTNKEKTDNKTCETTGGYLKVYEYKEAWKIAWNKATSEDKQLLYDLPNFDSEVFKEISGIDIEQKRKIVIDGKEIEVSEESFNELKKSLL